MSVYKLLFSLHDNSFIYEIKIQVNKLIQNGQRIFSKGKPNCHIFIWLFGTVISALEELIKSSHPLVSLQDNPSTHGLKRSHFSARSEWSQEFR